MPVLLRIWSALLSSKRAFSPWLSLYLIFVMGESCSAPIFIYKKIVLFGHTRSGRSSLVIRLNTGEVPPKQIYSGTHDAIKVSDDGNFRVVLSEFDARSHDRFLYSSACSRADGIIYVINSARGSFDIDIDYLNLIFELEDPKDITLMVVANQQDLEGAVKPEVIEREIKENCKIRPGFTWFVMPMSVMSEDDHRVELAYRLLMKTIKRKEAGRAKEGLIQRAWKKAKKDAEDSGSEDNDGDGDGKMKKFKKFLSKDPIQMIKSLLIR